MHESIDSMSSAVGKTIIRIAQGSLSFARIGEGKSNEIVYESYDMNRSISLVANLREAFQTSDLLKGGDEEALVLVDSNQLLIPESEFAEEQTDTLYEHTFTETNNEVKLFDELPALNVKVVYSLNKDLKHLIEEHFSNVCYSSLCVPVWNAFYHRTGNSPQRKLFGYFHDKKLEVFAFSQKRFKFCNTYAVTHVNDVLYFLLFVWEQLAFDQEKDELFIAGSVPNEEWLAAQLRRYIQRVSFVSSGSESVPYDISLLRPENH